MYTIDVVGKAGSDKFRTFWVMQFQPFTSCSLYGASNSRKEFQTRAFEWCDVSWVQGVILVTDGEHRFSVHAKLRPPFLGVASTNNHLSCSIGVDANGLERGHNRSAGVTGLEQGLERGPSELSVHIHDFSLWPPATPPIPTCYCYHHSIIHQRDLRIFIVQKEHRFYLQISMDFISSHTSTHGVAYVYKPDRAVGHKRS